MQGSACCQPVESIRDKKQVAGMKADLNWWQLTPTARDLDNPGESVFEVILGIRAVLSLFVFDVALRCTIKTQIPQGKIKVWGLFDWLYLA